MTDLELVREFPLVPIVDDSGLDLAISALNRVLDVDRDRTPDEEAYILVLGDIIEAYETEHIPMPYVSPAAMLRFLIEQKGVSQIEVAEATGISEATISQILTEKRQPSRKVIPRLAEYFAIDPAVFLG